MFLISTETGKFVALDLKNTSIDVKNMPPSDSTKNDSANGSDQPLPSSLANPLNTLSGISNIRGSCGGCLLGRGTGAGTGTGTGGTGTGTGAGTGAGVGAGGGT